MVRAGMLEPAELSSHDTRVMPAQFPVYTAIPRSVAEVPVDPGCMDIEWGLLLTLFMVNHTSPVAPSTKPAQPGLG